MKILKHASLLLALSLIVPTYIRPVDPPDHDIPASVPYAWLVVAIGASFLFFKYCTLKMRQSEEERDIRNALDVMGYSREEADKVINEGRAERIRYNESHAGHIRYSVRIHPKEETDKISMKG